MIILFLTHTKSHTNKFNHILSITIRKKNLWGHFLGQLFGPWQWGMQDSMKTCTLIFLLSILNSFKKTGAFYAQFLYQTCFNYIFSLNLGTFSSAFSSTVPHAPLRSDTGGSSRHCAKGETIQLSN